MILENFEDKLPKECVTTYSEKDTPTSADLFTFVSGLKQIVSTFVSRDSGIEVLKSILAKLDELHNQMTYGKNGFTVAKPLALGVTELGWVEEIATSN